MSSNYTVIQGMRINRPTHIAASIDDRARGERIFRGEVIVQGGIGALDELIAHADTMIRAAFAPHDPLRAHEAIEPAAYAQIAEALIAAFQRNDDTRALFRSMLKAAGVDTARVYWDKLRLRVQPPGDRHQSRHVLNLPPHRDTWGSNLLCQINWWAPLYPLTAMRTMVLYPAHWQTPIANTSAAWDYDEMRRPLRRGGDYPLLPVATGKVDDSGAWPALIDPGELLCFSGAHLHASVANGTDVARFNIETRTVALDDLAEARQAPDKDHAAPRRPLEWFVRIDDGAPLPGARQANVRHKNDS